jgi:hypothetical protein
MMENSMSKEANALLLKLLASGINAAGAHCSRSDTPTPEEEPAEPCEPDEPDDDDKGGTKIRFL